MSYKIVDQPLSYIAYVIVISMFVAIILIYTTIFSKGITMMLTKVYTLSIATKINLANTFPEGTRVCIPINDIEIYKNVNATIIQTLNYRLLEVDVKVGNSIVSSYVPIVPIIATNKVTKSVRIDGKPYTYEKYFSMLMAVGNNVETPLGKVGKNSVSTLTPSSVKISSDVVFYPPGTEILPYVKTKYNTQIFIWKIKMSGYVCFVKKDGVLVPQ